MGLRGPAPQPTAIRILEGNPGKRAINKSEPQYEQKIPKCPGHLEPEAKKEWKRVAKMLLASRVLTEADYMPLANLCQAWVTLKKAQEGLNKSGFLLKTPSGYVQQSPLLSIVNQQVEIVNKLCREFGMTPSSRSRLSIAPQEKKIDAIELALCGGDSDPLSVVQ